ncbi:uncharacterized protein DSM5745_09890 [Aspergillus mulundensis]|uniref:Uncharacterized protein n=1 Tax=Aspergillus mulundensis TaxID=1810919 RepID=A0A3D8QRN7_9EURO|nr:hypothetical protein DSM5745_09890 [Aspergillus mulundensis]RDW64479.1 hypothetical protein DSM5745_09890 [Aspergillus mulundensis]
MSTENPGYNRHDDEGSFGFPGWDSFAEQEDGAPFTRGLHLDEVMQGPAARHGNKDAGDEEEHMAMRQGRKAQPGTEQYSQDSNDTPGPGTYTGLEETWTSESLAELKKGGRKMPL